MKNKVIFLNTHPVNYFTDLYRYITKESNKIDLEVWFSNLYGIGNHFDKQFNQNRHISKEILKGFNYKLFSGSKKDPRSIFHFDWGLVKRLNENQNALIICHGWQNFTLIFVLLFGKIFGLKVGLRIEQPLNQELKNSKFKLIFRTIFFRILNKQIDFFFFIGTRNKELYDYYGINKNKLIFLPYATASVRSKVEYKFQKKIKKILFCGKLIRKKNPMDLLKAFHKVNLNYCQLSFVGNGELKQKLKDYVKENDLSSRVKFYGLLDKKEVYKKYEDADLFILPSGDGETWGLVVNEALNFGLPLILSNTVGSSIDLCNGNGFTFEENDIDDLALKINHFFNLNDEEIKEMRYHSKKLVNRYSFNTILKNLENISI